MGPDDPRLWIVPHQDLDRFVVGMGVQIEIVGDSEFDGLLHQLVLGRFAGQMKLANAAIVARLNSSCTRSKMTGSPNQLWISARTRYGRMNGTTHKPSAFASINA